MATPTTKDIALKIRTILAKITHQLPTDIGGDANLGNPPPLGLDDAQIGSLLATINGYLAKNEAPGRVKSTEVKGSMKVAALIKLVVGKFKPLPPKKVTAKSKSV